MSDTIKGVVLTLESDLRPEQSQELIKALGLIRGVVSVDPVPSDHCADFVTETRVRCDLQKHILSFIWPQYRGIEV